MPRKPRELVDEAVYHLFNRGNNRRDLFQEREDFQAFLQELLKAKTKYQVFLYHYCLMTNHYHLLLQIPRGDDLPRLMHQVQLGYARYFKKKYGFIGHLFQERFRSPRIPEESYYLQCGRYIERNPVKAGLVQRAWDYPYSSAAFYALGFRDPLVTPNLYYQDTGRSEGERQASYQKFLLQDEPYGEIIEEALTRV